MYMCVGVSSEGEEEERSVVLGSPLISCNQDMLQTTKKSMLVVIFFIANPTLRFS